MNHLVRHFTRPRKKWRQCTLAPFLLVLVGIGALAVEPAHTQSLGDPPFEFALTQEWPGDNSAVTALEFNPDGTILLIGTSAGRLYKWRLDMEPRPAQVGAFGGTVADIAFLPNGEKAFAATGSGVHAWSLRGGTSAFGAKAPRGLSALATDPRGAVVAGAGSGKDITVWHAATGGSAGRLTGPKKGVVYLGFAKESNLLIAVAKEKEIQLSDVSTQRVVRTITEAKTSMLAADHNLQGHLLAVGQMVVKLKRGTLKKTHRVIVYNTLTGERVAVLPEPGQARAVALTPDARFVAVGTYPDVAAGPGSAVYKSRAGIRIWHIGRIERVARLSTRTYATAIAISPTGRFMAVGEKDGRMALFRLSGVFLLFSTNKEQRPEKNCQAKGLSFFSMRTAICCPSGGGAPQSCALHVAGTKHSGCELVSNRFLCA